MPVINLDPSLDNVACCLWSNLGALNSTTVTAAGEVSGFPAVNVVDPATYNSWTAAAPAGARIQFSYNMPRTVKAIGIAAHSLGSAGATVNIRSSTDGSSWTVRHSFAPTTNEDVLVILDSSYSAQYWDLNISEPGNIGVLFMGPLLTFPCTPIDSYTPTHHAKRYTKYFNNSLQGQFLGNRVMGAGGNTSVQFPHLSRSWVDGPLTGFENHYNRGGTFFYAGWPGGKPQDMAYAWPGSNDSILDVEYVQAEKLATLSFDMQFYNPT